jgi:hypothetical protein
MADRRRPGTRKAATRAASPSAGAPRATQAPQSHRAARPAASNDLSGATSAARNDPTAFDLWCAAHLSGGATLRRHERSAGGAPGRLDAAQLASPNAVLEVHFADGSVFYTDPADFVARHGKAGAQRGGTGGVEIELPFDLGGQRTGATRGAGAPVERYTVSELTEPSSLDRLYDFAALLGKTVQRWLPGQKPADAPLATKLCAAFENATLDPALGERGGLLLQWREQRWQPLQQQPLAARGDRVLLFLHGTASSTAGSFGKLWAAGEGGAEPADLDALAERATLLAWEHRSLTRSPLDNVTELIEALLGALPARPVLTVDLVSHSRGGLIGELFSLCGAGRLEPAREAFARFFGPVGTQGDAGEPHPDLPLVAALFDALPAAAQRLQPGTFVRVACPARGTLLADGRTDLFLSLLLRAVGLALGGVGSVLFDRFGQLVRSLVAARADARRLPGLEAMIPGSPLTLALAHCGAQPADRLRVIAGDTQGKGWGGIVTLLGDVFYGLHDHDFVVHTRSMFGGLARQQQAPLSLRCEGAGVTHFGYFAPGSTSRAALLAALAGRDEGFSPLADDEARTRGERGVWQLFKGEPLARRTFTEWLAEIKRPANAGKPVLVVLPGIMGSELALPKGDGSGELVWLSMAAMLDGSLEHLALDEADLLRASGLLAASYERLLVGAQSRFRVVAVPFDWRRPIAESGALLRERLLRIDEALADATQPIHLLVHSMGGLVARQALYVDEAGRALWGRLKPRGSRLVMLGTPNKGSYAPAMLLLRQYPLASMLALMARKVSDKDMARFGAGFPGLLQMLPQTPDADFGDLFDTASWQRIARIDGSAQLPDPAVLAQARSFVTGPFADSFEALRQDPAAFYVAGSGPTAVQMRASQNPWDGALGDASPTPARAIEFMASPEGDGTVPWSSTLAPERTWYASCGHGSLPDHVAAFEAYFELLTAGHTQRLPQQPPRARAAAGDAGATAALNAMPPVAQPALLPTSDEELAAYILEHGSAAPTAAPAPEPIAVRVIHGGLDYARYPLMVGHYQNAELSGAAKRVDEKLDGQLSQLLSLGLFVGATRTGHYLRPNNRSTQPPAYPGALMLGLGTVGELTPGVLADTVTRGVLRYAFEHVHRDPYAAAPGETVDLRLSTVLVGTHVQAVTPRDSLAGVLYGVWRASQMLSEMRGGVGQPVRIGEVEILEIEEHIALDAAYELRRLLQRDEWAERLRWDSPVLEVREGGLSGYRPRTVDSVWQRLVVRQNATGGLNFALIGERARVESTQVYSDVASLRRFIDRVSDNRAAGGDRIAGPTDPRFGGVLFQMLLPFELKERLANLDNTVLVLDDESARYPWELLSPPLTGPADGERPRPFVVHAGMVRQRATDEFQRLLPALVGRHALIVGAPGTGNWQQQDGRPLVFSRLPGAAAEAGAVKALLADDGRIGEPVALIGEAVSFEQVRIALLERPYRLLHLCGHGVVDQWVRQLDAGPASRELRKTGMVLSDQEILSAADVRQMSPVPEFVFINCCYSGRDSETAPARGPYPVLAASLALEFIRMGSRAVVAAGWQVDDAAALQFATALYAALLQGDSFGDAVLGARQAVYADSGLRHNTWGAYQCYGDPQWRLVPASVQVAHPGGTSRLREAQRCMSADELAARIRQVVGIAGDKAAAAVRAQLDQLVAALAADEHRACWLEHSSVQAALGEAYREIGEHELAARWLQLGARSAYSNVQIGQLELLVNSLSRGADPHAPRAAARLLDRLDAISNDSVARWPLADAEAERGTAASERLCQRGHLVLRRAGQRLAAPQDEDRLADVAADMAAAAALFAEAWHSKKRFDPDTDRRAHALSNALMAAALAAFAGGEPQQAVDALAAGTAQAAAGAMRIDDWLAAARALQDELIAHDEIATFWHQTNRLELQVAATVLAHTQSLKHPLDELGHALELLDRALVRWPSPSQLDSLAHRLHLVRALAQALEQADSPYDDLRHLLPVLAEQALERLKPQVGGASR